MTKEAEEFCPRCDELLGEGSFDPGCNYGCGYKAGPGCHEKFCSEKCFSNYCEAAAERAYEDFHAGDSAGVALERQMRDAGRWR